jgi:DNA-binding protein H-NS
MVNATDVSTKAPAKASTVNLSTLSDEELADLVAAAEGEIVARRERKKEEFLSSFREAMNALGLSPAEVAASLGGRRRGKGIGSTGRRAQVQPKYRNPASPEQTWSGRGKKPKWLEVQIAKGKKVEEFAIA